MFLAGWFSAASISLLYFAGVLHLGILVSTTKVCIMTLHFAAEELGTREADATTLGLSRTQFMYHVVLHVTNYNQENTQYKKLWGIH